VLPSLDARLARAADAVLRERGVDVRLGTSVTEATMDGVHLSTGEYVPTRSLIWCVGVRPDPLVQGLGLETMQGRLVVDEFLTVPGHPDVYACGDAAAVPDLTRPGEITGMTAQHATRQGTTVARNIAASYGSGRRRAYKHHDLGFVVDLGGLDSAANPLGVPLKGFPAKVVTRGYHLLSMPGNRVRVAADWLLDLLLPRQGVQLGLVPGSAIPLDSARPAETAAPRR
jgi:NADH dehydrogenase